MENINFGYSVKTKQTIFSVANRAMTEAMNWISILNRVTVRSKWTFTPCFRKWSKSCTELDQARAVE